MFYKFCLQNYNFFSKKLSICSNLMQFLLHNAIFMQRNLKNAVFDFLLSFFLHC